MSPLTTFSFSPVLWWSFPLRQSKRNESQGQRRCKRVKNKHPDRVRAVTCPSGPIFDVSSKQKGQKPPTWQNKGTRHFPYKCAVERTLKTRVRVSRCARLRDDTMSHVFEKATCVWCWGRVKGLPSSEERERGKGSVVLKLSLGCEVVICILSSATPATFWASAGQMRVAQQKKKDKHKSTVLVWSMSKISFWKCFVYTCVMDERKH